MNRLGAETSPYLLQHAENPVDWFAWGEEAIAAARQLNRPLLVSIGYSACHWCHVMAHESFENPAIAQQMNESFVCVKVDREERPDIDAICMDACQAMTGQGGWPLNVFLTPELQPFYAGTYFPPDERGGPRMPSWPMVLEAVAQAWRERPEKVREQGMQMAEAISANAALERQGQAAVSKTVIRDSVEALSRSLDQVNGGWGSAPKFPSHGTLGFLLSVAAGDVAPAAADADTAPDAKTRQGALQIALKTLRSMAAGGIYDQVGGGFARYTVDATWTVPHFEKMLYDNALLARTFLHGYQLSDDPRLEEVCCQTLDWALREMRGEEGGFCAALDADSGGVEGSFYVWTLAELREALEPLGEAAVQTALAYFGATEQGNFEGSNVLEARGQRPEQLPQIRELLLKARSGRVRPGLDDKRLTAWNALMIMALADAGAVLARDDYLQAACGCAEFLLSELVDEHGALLRTWKDGHARLAAYLEDYAYLVQALTILYEATFDERWYIAAVQFAEQMIDRFGDREHGGFFTTAVDQPHLVTRRKDLEDAPTPSGNSAAALGLLRLSRISGNETFARWAVGVLALNAQIAERHPSAFGHLLRALDLYMSPSREVAVIGEPATGPMTRMLRSRPLAHMVIAGQDDLALAAQRPSRVPLLADRTMIDGRPAAYVCENFSCRLPVSSVQELEQLLRS